MAAGRATRELEELNDHVLADLGIDRRFRTRREDIAHVVRERMLTSYASRWGHPETTVTYEAGVGQTVRRD